MSDKPKTSKAFSVNGFKPVTTKEFIAEAILVGTKLFRKPKNKENKK